MPERARRGNLCNAAEPTRELRSYAHRHAVDYFRFADARLTSIHPVLSSIVPVGLWTAMAANWTSLGENAVLVGCALASLLFYCAFWVVLAYSNAYEHLVALGTEYREKAGGDGTDWEDRQEKYTPSVPKALNFGILAPGIFRPLAWMYFVGVLASEGAAIEWLSVHHMAAAIWIPLYGGSLVALAAFGTNWQYLAYTARKWAQTAGRREDNAPSAAAGGSTGRSPRRAPAQGLSPSSGKGSVIRKPRPVSGRR